MLYGLQLESMKPGTQNFDLVIYKNNDDESVLVVKSIDGEESWLFSSIERKMKKREANIHKYAREILNLERRAQRPSSVSWRRSNPNMIGYEVSLVGWVVGERALSLISGQVSLLGRHVTDRARPSLSAIQVMRSVWSRFFRKVDGVLDTDLASNPFLLNVAPFFPIMALGLLVALSGEFNYQFGDMGFLHY